jgi:hypothetical protein
LKENPVEYGNIHGAPRAKARGTLFTPTRKIWRNSLRQFRHTRRGYPPTCYFGGIRRSATAFYRIHPRLKKPWYSAKVDKKYFRAFEELVFYANIFFSYSLVYFIDRL